MLNLVVRKETVRVYKVKTSKSRTVFVTDILDRPFATSFWWWLFSGK
jgi:hypothetical protein